MLERKRRGFTLVEVIVVLVILAILAAIAIPALTGYIEKAQDKQYISYARNCAVAVRTVIQEAYAEGRFDFSPDAITSDYWNKGTTLPTWYKGSGNTKFFQWDTISRYLYGGTDPIDDYTVQRKALELLANGDPPPNADYGDQFATWALSFLNSSSTSSTILNADGFIWLHWAEDGEVGKHKAIIVTYKAKKVPLTDNKYLSFAVGWASASQLVYDPGAGYEVYNLVL